MVYDVSPSSTCKTLNHDALNIYLPRFRFRFIVRRGGCLHPKRLSLLEPAASLKHIKFGNFRNFYNINALKTKPTKIFGSKHGRLKRLPYSLRKLV